ncbi:esterase-like activity of phytase family protein [Synechocystis sp. LKSZ1]|uniref:esterase-like activity of phytase family protein n=1 Tax=Synechocystis sp. LKSZ1 TaxID=3144951 RepID=UPI00336BBAFD
MTINSGSSLTTNLETFEFKNLPTIGTTTAGQELFLGGFSGLFYEGTAPNGNLKFVTHTDRGPNGEPTGSNRPFLLPDFSPEIVRFELNRLTGVVTITQRLSLKQADGTPISGLPNLSVTGGNGNTPYNDEVPVDLFGNVITPLDNLGGDLEGIVVNPTDGTFWMVDEYRPAIYHFDTEGKLIDRFVPVGTAAAVGQTPGDFGDEVLPAVLAQRRQNRGFEAVALNTDNGKLYAFVQSPLRNPATLSNATLNGLNNIRIVEFDVATKTVTAEYLYRMDNLNLGGGDNTRADKIGDAVYIGNGQFLVVERDDDAIDSDPLATIEKKVYRFSLDDATNILGKDAPIDLGGGTLKTIDQMTPAELASQDINLVNKALYIDLAQAGYNTVEKVEGLTIIDANTVAVLNDNDFRVAGITIDNATGTFTLNDNYTPEPALLGVISTTPSDGSVSSIDLSTYVRIGRYDLPEPTRTTPPDSTSLLAQEASAVTYNWDTDTLFVIGDGSTSIVEVSKTGQLISSMTLALGNSPQGTEFYDTEGITYVGNGQFVLVEERYRQVSLFTYVAGNTLTRNDVKTVDLGTNIGNIGIEGISYDPLTNDYIAVKEADPEGIFQTGIDFNNGTATNGSATVENSTNLFTPALGNLEDFSDVFALSNLPNLNGQADYRNILILSQESGKIVEVDRSGKILSSLTLVSDTDNPLSIADQTHEGLTMDKNGNLYVVSENGGGDSDHPQLWVYAPSDVANTAPTAVVLNSPVVSIPESTSVASRIKLATIAVTDADGVGSNNLSLSGADANVFEIIGTGLYLKAGTELNYAKQSSYGVKVNVDDPAVGTNTPDASIDFTLQLTDVNGGSGSLIISEVAPWSSGNSPVGADWFEVTNIGNSPVNITGWKMDDNSNSFNSAVLLNGVTTIAAGESVIFIESSDPTTTITNFKSVWFGNTPPANLQIGTYQGSGVGLSTGGDVVNLFDANGIVRANVAFGTSPTGPFSTFDNAIGLNNEAISQLSSVGVQGGFVAANAADEIGSPGTVGTGAIPLVSIIAIDADAAETGNDTATFRVSRTLNTLTPLSINYTIGTGVGQVSTNDYTANPALTGVITIPAGQSFADITITPVDDALQEGDETLTLSLGDTGSYDVGSAGSATITIADNDNNASSFTLQILHYYGESGLLGVETAPIMGALIDKFDDQYANTLVLGEGDSYIPGPWLVGGADPSLNAIPSIRSTALGRPDIAIMNIFGTDASALGNHEFDLGSPVLQGAIASSGTWVGAQFPLITANLNFAADSSLRGLADASLGGTSTNAFAGQEASAIKGKIAPYAVVTQNGEKIGIVGATTYDLLSKSSPNGTVPKDDGNPSTDDLQEVAVYIQAAVNALTAQGVNKIVMLDQLDTLDRNKLLAPLVSGIDVMVAGGGHERMGDATDTPAAFNGHDADFIADAYPIVTAGSDGKPTLIVTTDTEYTYLGRLVVNFDSNGEIIFNNLDPVVNGAYASTEATLQAAYGTTNSASQIIASSTIGSQVKQIVDAIDNVIITKDGTIWGYTNVYLEGDRVFGRTQEVNLGNITADANLYAAQQALGGGFVTSLKNGGGIRASIGSIAEDGTKVPPSATNVKPVGGISTLDIENALRFDNKLIVFDTTPQGLKNILEFAAGLSSGPSQQNGGYMQIGGIRVSYDPDNPTGSKVKSIALINLSGNETAVIYQDGAFNPDAPNTIQMVILNFTANGGDGYPIKENGSNFRYLLTDGTLSAPLDEALDFTAPANVPVNALGEQKSFQDYLQEFYATPGTAYGVADTPASQDQRIQNLNFREDTVVAPTGNLVTGSPNADVLLAGQDLVGIKDILFTGAGNDQVDVIIGGQGRGNNRINLGSGADTIDVSNGDRAFGSTGNDVLDATDASGYRLSGGAGNDDFFLGTNGQVIGGDGNDRFFVQAGGGNILSGGAGADQFWMLTDSLPSFPNTIVDFTPGTDVIGIANQGASVDFSDLSFSGNNIVLNGVTFATLTGIQTNTLTAASFVFV